MPAATSWGSNMRNSQSSTCARAASSSPGVTSDWWPRLVRVRMTSRTGVDISYIFSREGEEGFRQREREVIEEVTRESPIVLATGGGAILLPENRTALRERGFVAYLKTSLEHQAERVRQGRNRPLLHDVDPLTKLTELMEIRAPLYESLANFTIATDGRKVHTVAEAIFAAFKAAQPQDEA